MVMKKMKLVLWLFAVGHHLIYMSPLITIAGFPFVIGPKKGEEERIRGRGGER